MSRRLLSAAPILIAGLALLAARPGPSPIPESSRQLILVTTPDWTATDGTLQRYERRAGGPWTPVGRGTPVVVGRSGLGWGRGLHGRQDGPQKREGDGRAPAGVFRLPAAFGYADRVETGLPYLASHASTQCVDDVDSRSYGLVLDSAAVADADWVSRERMRRDDALYQLGVVVAHNGPGVAETLLSGLPTSETDPGGGSCIFLHVWRGAGTSTAGCTAGPEGALASTLAWLDADADPVLVQLPAAQRALLGEMWGLPVES